MENGNRNQPHNLKASIGGNHMPDRQSTGTPTNIPCHALESPRRMKYFSLSPSGERVCLGALVALLLNTPLHVRAEEPGVRQADTRYNVKIDSQPIGSALKTLADQTGLQVLVLSQDAADKRAPTVHGNLTNEEALLRILDDSGLTYESIDDNTVAIRNKDAVPASATALRKTSWNSGANAIRLAQNDASSSNSHPGTGPSPETGKSQGEGNKDIVEVQEVVVTGSRIRGHVNPSAPIYSVTSEDIEQQGLSITDDIFRSITQVSGRGSMSALAVNDQVPLGSVGHSSVDLGGFGVKSTLVLINGRRTANSSIMNGASVNVSTIPVSAIDRVDVLPTAASAIYGADAVGGVVNIILKKRTEFAANTSLRHENSSVDADGWQASQDLSFGWSSGRFTGVASYQHSDPVEVKELGYTTKDYRSRGGYDFRNRYFGESGLIAGLGSLPPGNDGTAFTPGDVSMANFVGVSSFPENLAPELNTTSVYVNAEQDVGSRVTLFVDGIYSKNDTIYYEGPHYTWGVEVPVSNAFNPFGRSVFVNYLFDTEHAAGRMPAIFREADQELLQGTFGAEIKLPRDWRMQLYVTDADEASLHSQTLVATADPNVIAALADPDPQTALNLFGDGTAQNPATLANIIGFWRQRRHLKLQSGMTDYVAQSDGDLFELPGGVVKASFAAEHRVESLSWAAFGNNQPQGSRTADSLAAEFALPLLGNVSNPASGPSLELTLAARWDRFNADGDFDYDGVEDQMEEFSDTSPMLGLAWKPTSSLRLRASWSKAFRAPVVRDLAGSPLTFTTQVFDPLAPDDPSTPQVEGPRMVQVQGSRPPSTGLGPETAEIWTAGIDWEQRSENGAGFKASLTYSDTDFEDRITFLGTYFDNDPTYFVSHPEIFPDGTQRDANGNLTDVYLRNINVAGQTAKAWNVGAEYAWRTSRGSLVTVSANGTYTDEFFEQVHAGAEVQKLQGTFNGPDRLRTVLRGGWTNADGSLSANVFVHTSSSYDNTIQTWAINNPPPGIGPQVVEKVSGYTTVDLSGSYRYRGASAWLDGVKLTAGVRNLFDQDFPFAQVNSGQLPFDPRRVDVRGRVAFLEFRKAFE
jgi:iron complex outermembrane recepter protein